MLLGGTKYFKFLVALESPKCSELSTNKAWTLYITKIIFHKSNNFGPQQIKKQ
jgi:hypothetical protein